MRPCHAFGMQALKMHLCSGPPAASPTQLAASRGIGVPLHKKNKWTRTAITLGIPGLQVVHLAHHGVEKGSPRTDRTLSGVSVLVRLGIPRRT